VLKNRVLIAALIAVWLAIGPVATVWATSAPQSCETMSAAPADDCCGNGMDHNKCLSACLPVSQVLSAPAFRVAAPALAEAVVAKLYLRHASFLAPPDIAPPRTPVS
jgi:hypothetical protein